jgi:hypothetical protein
MIGELHRVHPHALRRLRKAPTLLLRLALGIGARLGSSVE